MSNADAIAWGRLHVRDPEGVPTQTGFFEISGSASSEVVDSRVYTRFLDPEKRLKLALLCGIMQILGRERLDYAAVAEQISLEEFERQLRVPSSNSNRIDILLCDCEAESAINIENKIRHSIMNEFPSHWNHVTYPNDQRLGILLTLYPTKVPYTCRSRFNSITQIGWIDAVVSESVQITKSLRLNAMSTNFLNAASDQSTDNSMNERERFCCDHRPQMGRDRPCTCRLSEIDHIGPQITSRLKRRIVFWGAGTIRLRDEGHTLKSPRSLIAPRPVTLGHRVAAGLSRCWARLAQGRREPAVQSETSGGALVVTMSLMRLVDTTLRMSAKIHELASGRQAGFESCMIEALMLVPNGPLCRELQGVRAKEVGYAIDSGDATTCRIRFIEAGHCANEDEALTNDYQENRTALDTPNSCGLSIVHIGSDQVSELRNLRRPNWSAPSFNAARLLSDLRKLLAREGASR